MLLAKNKSPNNAGILAKAERLGERVLSGIRQILAPWFAKGSLACFQR